MSSFRRACKVKVHVLILRSIVVKAEDVQLALEVVHDKVLGIPRHEEKENAFAKGPWLY